MKKSLFSELIASGLILMLLCSCSTTNNVTVTSGIDKIDKSSINEGPVELPGGYDVDDFRRLRIGLGYGKIQSNAPVFQQKENEDFMNLRFQSEMDKHKRFIIIALYGANNSKLDALTDLGEIEANNEDDNAHYQRPKINLTWNINIQETTKPVGKYEQIIQWYCTINATASYYDNVMSQDGTSVKHHKGDIAFTRDFDLPVIEKTQKLSASGHVISGFNYHKVDSDVRALMQEIIIAASQRIADDLGRCFPVGGAVVGALGTDLFTIDKGTMQGVEKGMEMIIFARYDGVDVPLANATASPAQDRSQLKVWRFANDKYARQILNEINGHPKQWCKDTGNELFGVRAVPMQDSTRGTRFDK